MRACLNQIENCPLKENRRKAVSHHLYYYRRDYPTPLEQAFRNASFNMLERCACIEQSDPHLNPLPKPSLQEMIVALTVEFDHES
jgi:hypothetical protein